MLIISRNKLLCCIFLSLAGPEIECDCALDFPPMGGSGSRQFPCGLAEMSSAENGLILSGPSVNF